MTSFDHAKDYITDRATNFVEFLTGEWRWFYILRVYAINTSDDRKTNDRSRQNTEYCSEYS